MVILDQFGYLHVKKDANKLQQLITLPLPNGTQLGKVRLITTLWLFKRVVVHADILNHELLKNITFQSVLSSTDS